MELGNYGDTSRNSQPFMSSRYGPPPALCPSGYSAPRHSATQHKFGRYVKCHCNSQSGARDYERPKRAKVVVARKLAARLQTTNPSSATRDAIDKGAGIKVLASQIMAAGNLS